MNRSLCIQQDAEAGTQLVFPAFFGIERPANPEKPPLFVTYEFSGFLDDIYATLVVRLHHSSAFETVRDRLYRDYAEFTSGTGSTIALQLFRDKEGRGKLEVYVAADTDEDTRVLFSRYERVRHQLLLSTLIALYVSAGLPQVDFNLLSAIAWNEVHRLHLKPLLFDWPRRIRDPRKWASVESPLPGLPHAAFEDVWVDLRFLAPLRANGAATHDFTTLDSRDESANWHVESSGFVLDGLQESTCLIGAPGTGKTTFLKWVASRLLDSADSRFLLPLYVPLRRYVSERRNNSCTNLLSFAIQFCGRTGETQTRQWTQAARRLSELTLPTVLLLLDGWDEVSADDRDALMDEIGDLSESFTFLLTSRPSASPRGSGLIKHCYEISELSSEAVPHLVRRWFAAADQPEFAEPLLRHIFASPDLLRMSRNPYLLTLLCGTGLDRMNRLDAASAPLPRTLTELYEETVRLIQLHSTKVPSRELDASKMKQVERLALWLLADAPGGPRFEFNGVDVDESGIDLELWTNVILRSRLLGGGQSMGESHRFLTPSLHRFLAARELVAEPEDVVADRIERHARNSDWGEVLQFVAGRTSSCPARFWESLAGAAQELDRFGLLAIRLARCVTEVGVTDGGLELLGVDLRETLWDFASQGAEFDRHADALIELDTEWYASRCKSLMVTALPEQRGVLERSLDRVFTPDSPEQLVLAILKGDRQISARGGHAIELVLDERSFGRLRDELLDPQLTDSIRRAIIRALGFSKDPASIAALNECHRQYPKTRNGVLRSLTHIGGEAVCELLAT